MYTHKKNIPVGIETSLIINMNIKEYKTAHAMVND